MAKILLNPLFYKPSGKFGNLVFRQLANGKTVVCCQSTRQNETQTQPGAARSPQRFKEAGEYATAILADPEGSAPAV